MEEKNTTKWGEMGKGGEMLEGRRTKKDTQTTITTTHSFTFPREREKRKKKNKKKQIDVNTGSHFGNIRSQQRHPLALQHCCSSTAINTSSSHHQQRLKKNVNHVSPLKASPEANVNQKQKKKKSFASPFIFLALRFSAETTSAPTTATITTTTVHTSLPG